MRAPPLSAAITEQDVQDAIARLARVEPGLHWVVTCYLKLEPRDRTRGKYLIKMKTRTKGLLLDYHDQPAVPADLAQVVDYLEQPNHLPRARAIAIFASRELGLFEVLPLPHVHRSRLAVSHEPLVRELLGLEEEFGTILAVVYDRTAARFFEVTAYDCIELPGLAGIETTRAGKFHGAGEHKFHQRIRTEKHRLYAQIADRFFFLNRPKPPAFIVFPGLGVFAC